ncbi:ATP-binding protein [Streptomyces luteolus]|uniref:ATP-binding protein n=1 Tax=Streptomyces luteolus TaxID=3043615 RepID=A0ABT6SZC4_9ACTN|nr:ATP-binding protein [Streptomyces sp. B-S-A12]MDI3420751.1 ATP-binding protein [Streptomyces sp. B-S-A12]
MTRSTEGFAPHPHIGGRTAALRALAAWRMEWPGSPRVIVLTGAPGSGVSRLVTGFLMLCDPEFRKQLPLDEMDPATVPPELPAPAAPSAEGRTSAQVLWALADHFDLVSDDTDEVYAELAALEQPVHVVVPDVDRAGPVPTVGEPARLVNDVLKRLAATETVRLLAEAPRPLAAELASGLGAGIVQVIDLDAPEWADQAALVRQAEAALDPQFGAPELPFTTDPAARRALAEVWGRRARSNALSVELTARCVLTAPDGFDPSAADAPTNVGDVLDWHARRVGCPPETLRSLLSPLALSEGRGEGLPVHLWVRLANAVGGQDLSGLAAESMLAIGPFVQPVGDDGEGGPTRLRLLHPAVADAVRATLPNVRTVQSRLAMALLEAVPEQDWSQADPYVRDHIAGHTLDAGLLPQLLTDPGLFVYADPLALRTAVESVPLESVGSPGRTYLRTAPLLTRTQASAELRAALLESAFVEDGLEDYASAVRQLGLDLPWQTLWSVRLPNVRGATVGYVPTAQGHAPVAVVMVPADTPGAAPVATEGAADQRLGLLIHSLTAPSAPLPDIDPQRILRPTAEERAAAPLALSRGADYLRVWDQAAGRIVAALISDTPFLAADLSPEGILLTATEHGVKALRIRPPASAIAS